MGKMKTSSCWALSLKSSQDAKTFRFSSLVLHFFFLRVIRFLHSSSNFTVGFSDSERLFWRLSGACRAPSPDPSRTV